ncbi:ABC transporter substrate-binding protein [Nonomuraea sp. M3C6]|uniref:ABC transporter substrate-binding protein n=1 Tax=Nonomuraea marmarensis TaxID=3351344 RepID=A0ABW7AU49_9ACTN
MLAALVPVTALVMAACTPGGSGSGSQPDNPSAPKNLTIALPTISPPFNGATQSNTALRMTSNIFDPLIFRDPKTNKLSPSLATAWEQISPTEWDLTIRQGVLFQDGTPMTAEDVAFTIGAQRLWGKDALEPTTLLDSFKSVTVVNGSTVRITTSYPDPVLLYRLTTQASFVVPKNYLLTKGETYFGTHPLGTGPYKVTAVAPGDHVTMAANDKYWGGKPPYQNLTFRAVSEVSSRVAGLLAGQYDIVTTIPPDQTDTITGGGASVDPVQVDNVVSLAFMTEQKGAPTSDPRVRQAMRAAVDWRSLTTSLWKDLTKPPAGLNVPAYGSFHNASQTPPAYDPSQAKALLQQAGYHGQQIELQYIRNYYTNFDAAVQVMQQQWSQVGLNVRLSPVADYTLLDYKKLNLYATSNNIAFPDPISPMWTDWVSPTSSYVTNGRFRPSSEMTKAGTTLSRNLDPAARKAAFNELLSEWDEAVPAISLWQPVEIYGVKSGLTFTADPRYWMRLAPIPAAS